MYNPPKIGVKILRWFCSDYLAEEIEGDLHEGYQNWRADHSRTISSLYYLFTIFRGLPTYYKSKTQKQKTSPFLMFNHYLLTAWRLVKKEKTVTGINLFGLSIGLASSLLLLLFIAEQLRKDFDLPGKDNIYRIEAKSSLSSRGFVTGIHPAISPLVQQDIPQISESTVLNKWDRDIIIDNGDGLSFFEESFLKADSSFFNIFPQIFLIGNKNTALTDPASVVVTESIALKYFGSDDPIGKEIKVVSNRRSKLIVSAVVKDPPPHSSLDFDLIIPQDVDYGLDSGGFSPGTIYVRLTEGVNLEAITSNTNELIQKHVDTPYLKSMSYRYRSLEDIKYDLSISDDIIVPANRTLYTIFMSIALLILLLAVINYVNLTTARGIKRGQEAGVRKIIGAGRFSFYSQFITESLLVAIVALPIAILLVEAFIPPFETALNTQLSFKHLYHPLFWVGSIGLVLLVGIIGGIYPALIVSRFKFSDFLKGKTAGTKKGQLFRKGLLLLQFALTITLLVGAFVVQRQLNLFNNLKFDYEPEQMLVLDRALSQNFDLLKNELLQIPEVLNVSNTSSPPGGDNHMVSGTMADLNEIVFGHKIDEDYLNLLNIEFLEGKNFDKETPALNDEGIIINETLAKLILAENPKNSEAPLKESYPFIMSEYKIRGVIKDFHLESLHTKIKPMAFTYNSFSGYEGAYVLINLRTTNLTETLAKIEEVWVEQIPDSPFRHQFVDSRFERFYTTEMRLGKVFQIFTGIALLVSCLGLFGFMSFTMQSKSKELTIRKVLGAKIPQIMGLFLKETYLLVLIASLVALPISYYLMGEWLNGFAYHTNIPITLSVAIILTVLLITTVTVTAQTIRTAKRNPVASLRSE